MQPTGHCEELCTKTPPNHGLALCQPIPGGHTNLSMMTFTQQQTYFIKMIGFLNLIIRVPITTLKYFLSMHKYLGFSSFYKGLLRFF